jgi:hypothetical protein
MAFELRLTFSGLTALVPNRKVSDPNPAKEWLVAMPALEKGRPIKRGNKSFSIPPHQAVMVMNVQAKKAGTTKRERLWFRDAAAENSLFQLNREVLEIDPGTHSGGPGLRVRSNNPTDQDLAQNPDHQHDIKWVVPINDCHNNGVPFKSGLINPTTLRPSNSLAGVVRLDQGRLESREVFRGNLAAQPSFYQFRKISSPPGTFRFRQPLAKGFRLRVSVAGDTAGLTLTDNSGNRKRLVVGPYPGCPVEEGVAIVEVKIFNQELEDIMGFGPNPNDPVDASLVRQGDTDFVIFYSLSPLWGTFNTNPNDLVLPYLEDEGGGGSAKPCEPPVFPGMEG